MSLEKPGGGQWLKCGEEGCWDLRLGASGHWTPPLLVLPPVGDLYVCGPTRPKGGTLAPKTVMSLLEFPGTDHCCFFQESSPPLLLPRRTQKGQGNLGQGYREYWEVQWEAVILYDSTMVVLNQVCVHQPTCMHALRHFQSHKLIDPLIYINIHLGHTHQTLQILRCLDTCWVPDSHLNSSHTRPHMQKSLGLLDPPVKDQLWVQCIVCQAQNANFVIKFHSSDFETYSWPVSESWIQFTGLQPTFQKVQ